MEALVRGTRSAAGHKGVLQTGTLQPSRMRLQWAIRFRSRKPLVDLLPETFLRFGPPQCRRTWRLRCIHRMLRISVISFLRLRFLRPAPFNLLLGPRLCPDHLVVRNEVV